ncbi:MAG TPA: glycosyltransferase family 4 protein [Kineosporiaceae bacterium]|nr:glycosyltransferase family 4 protein [Kineosporiaceae bacterium]
MTERDAWRVLLVLATSGGGTGRHVAALAAGLRAAGNVVTVAGPAATLAALDLPADVPRATLAVRTRPDPRRDLAAVLALRRLARDADVVHAHGVRAGALAVLAARSLPERPAVVVTAHNAALGGRGVRAVHAALTTVVARGADAVLGVSADLVDELRARGARQAARALVPAPPLPPASTAPAAVRAALGVPAGAALLVTVGRLAAQKGVDVLADAVADLARDPGRRVLAVVAGEGPLEERLRGGPLTLLGARRDVADLLAAADVVVVPSRWEGQPLVVQEALRAGAAVVATDAGGTREVAGDAAVLVPPGDARALADGVRGVLDDPGERDRLRAAALVRAAALPTEEDALGQVGKIYGRVAQAARRDRPTTL